MIEIPIVRDVLEESHQRALENRRLFLRHKVFVVNLMSSPGAGKTLLLEKTIPILKSQGVQCGVIEGDITSTLDSARIAALQVPVVQANTQPFGGDCHIGPHLIQGALKFLDLQALDILFIENVGNLVCPAEFYLGEDLRVVLLSLPEGEDKPLKYPLMFRETHLCLITKMDLLPYLNVDVSTIRQNINAVNGNLTVIEISALTGIGLSQWLDYLLNARAHFISQIEEGTLSTM